MSCEQHKKALIEGAASNEPLPLDLRAHIDSCSSCRVTLESERSLFAAIDSSLHAAANPPVPSSFLPAVHLRLAQELATSKSAKLALPASWMFLSAAAALVFALVPVLRRARNIDGPPQPAVTSTSVESGQVARTGPQTNVTQVASANRSTKNRAWPRANSARLTNRKPEPEVIVPADERIALAQYVSSFYAHEKDAGRPNTVVVAMTGSVPESQAKPLKIEPLQIAELAVEPMQDRHREEDARTQIR
jgi:hypothetical protein